MNLTPLKQLSVNEYHVAVLPFFLLNNFAYRDDIDTFKDLSPNVIAIDLAHNLRQTLLEPIWSSIWENIGIPIHNSILNSILNDFIRGETNETHTS